MPEVVNNDKNGYKSIAYSQMVAVLIEAVKEQQQIIDKQAKALQKQQKQIDKIQKRLDFSLNR